MDSLILQDSSVLSDAWLYSGLDDGAPYHSFPWTIGRRQKTVEEHIGSFSGWANPAPYLGNATVGRVVSVVAVIRILVTHT
jgi:hypothetical protein